MPRFGSHVSISKGYLEAAKAALAQGGSAFQYFPKNPRSLAVKAVNQGDAMRCAAFCRENGLLSIAHSPYPANLAVEDSSKQEQTVASLINDLEIAELCGSVGVVVHFGIYKGKDPLQGYKNIIQTLDKTVLQWQGRAKLLIENQAGDHALMGTTFEELVQIRGLTRCPDKIAFCLDTCHLFASGVWQEPENLKFVDQARKLGYMEHLAAVHMNDSVYPSGSQQDRHAAVGEGYIGEPGIRAFLKLPELKDIPVVLETRKDASGTHGEQIKLLKQWME
ncbi:deoxyribonuclease IV [Paenibacillus sp. GCM10012307]|uniref:Deoxyribonuclease IV n=1 Tax=Paenibacillus roseus TaxID=2798579 RepID=A0A934JB99_9BACL|nr:deoxyribonuclease IV [Paenibacillus roseus]MBJ6363658.1 deoxyribonuclease IV [Paenibacillus roseus]